MSKKNWVYVCLMLAAAGLAILSCSNDGGGGNVTVLYSEDFEDGDIFNDGWVDESSGAVSYSVPSPGADSSTYCAQVDGVGNPGNPQNYTGMSHSWGTGSGIRPGYVSFWLKSPDYSSGSSGHVALRMEGDPPYSCILLHMTQNNSSDSSFYINDVTFSGYATDTWYQLDFKNIDWASQTMDLYINGSLAASGIGFKNTQCTAVERMDVYNMFASTLCSIDEIRMTDQ
jgi:hypothetical protein